MVFRHHTLHYVKVSIEEFRLNIHIQPTLLSFEQCFILFCNFPLLFAFVVGGLGFELCVFVAGWRHALRSEWPFIIIIH